MTNINPSKEPYLSLVLTRIIGYFSIAFIVCASIGTIVVSRHLEREYEKNQVLREINRKKTNTVIEVFNALMAMAEFREITSLYCEQEKSPDAAQKRALERINLRYKLLKANNLARGNIDENLRTAIEEFAAWDNSIADYCAKDAPSKSEWLSKQQPIEDRLFSLKLKKS